MPCRHLYKLPEYLLFSESPTDHLVLRPGYLHLKNLQSHSSVLHPTLRCDVSEASPFSPQLSEALHSQESLKPLSRTDSAYARKKISAPWTLPTENFQGSVFWSSHHTQDLLYVPYTVSPSQIPQPLFILPSSNSSSDQILQVSDPAAYGKWLSSNAF